MCPERRTQSEGEQLSVLYAEDDAISCAVVQNYFERAGWEVHSVRSGQEALQSLAERRFDLVVSDFSFPDIDGRELLQRIRERWPSHPLIVTAGVGSVQDYVSLLQDGATDVLQKPIDIATFERCVKRAISSAEQKAFESTLHRFVSEESIRFAFSTLDISGVKFPLHCLERLERAGRLDPQDRLKLELAFQEALTNSIDHGNLELASEWKESFDAEGIDRYSRERKARLADPRYAGRPIEIEIRYDQESLIILIQDHGQGFEVENVVSTEKPDEVLPHGRGLTLIRSAVDELQYLDRGRRVAMVKRLMPS